ncbi:MAG: hypothetical protein CL927_12350 [Deltaproteobacteria bacterium]|nr:hypothetical protein [Deltaproteobacteria bacterium]HCH64362.1 hypothetical protein [Deltaproteobacteria bacterium]
MIGILMLVGLVSAGASEDLQQAFARWPEDYATAAALGAAALADHDGTWAVRAWTRAAALSNGNLESRVGLVRAYTLAGAHGEATSRAHDLVEAYPHTPTALATLGWAQRWQPRLPQRSAIHAARSYEAALQLGGTDAYHCGVGWSRVQLGDRMGAHHAFAKTSARCGREGTAATQPAWSTWGTTVGGVTRFVEHPWRTRSTHMGLQAGLQRSSQVGVDITARRVGLQGVEARTRSTPAGSSATPIRARQDEIWLGGRTRARRVGVDARLGWARTVGDIDATALVMGGRGWAQLSPVTLGITGFSGAYSDGSHRQMGLDVDLPVTLDWAVSSGVQHTRFVAASGPSGAQTGTMGWVGARWLPRTHPWSAEAAVRIGREVRPVRLASTAVWNFEEPLLTSGMLSAGRLLGARCTGFAGVEVGALAVPEQAPPDGSLAAHTVVAGHMGLRVQSGPRAEERR